MNGELRGRAEDAVMRLQAQGLSLEQFLEATGQDQAQFVEQLKEAAAKAVKVDLALRAVADAEQLQATDEDLDINGPLLAPGLGAQGGTADGLRAVFGSAVRNVVPSSSREILGAGPNAIGLQDAAARANDTYRTVLGH